MKQSDYEDNVLEKQWLQEMRLNKKQKSQCRIAQWWWWWWGGAWGYWSWVGFWVGAWIIRVTSMSQVRETVEGTQALISLLQWYWRPKQLEHLVFLQMWFIILRQDLRLWIPIHYCVQSKFKIPKKCCEILQLWWFSCTTCRQCKGLVFTLNLLKYLILCTSYSVYRTLVYNMLDLLKPFESWEGADTVSVARCSREAVSYKPQQQPCSKQTSIKMQRCSSCAEKVPFTCLPASDVPSFVFHCCSCGACLSRPKLDFRHDKRSKAQITSEDHSFQFSKHMNGRSKSGGVIISWSNYNKSCMNLKKSLRTKSVTAVLLVAAWKPLEPSFSWI